MIHEQRDKINFYMCDNIEFMKSKPDKYYDLAIVDPEYGIGAGKMTMGTGKHKFKQGKDWDKKIPDDEYFNELFRVSKNQIIWGGNYFTSILPPTKHWIVWDKLNPNLSFAEGELAWQSFGKLLRIYKNYSANHDKIHPTQKPVDLYRWILNKYAKKGIKILDTHGGSMTHAIACDMEGFALDICEIDEDYFKAGLKAFDEYKSQLKLF